MKNKNGMIEIWRFVAAIMIMLCHLYFGEKGLYPFCETWIFVEFFFILSGYFTAKHFAKRFLKDQNRSQKLFGKAEAVSFKEWGSELGRLMHSKVVKLVPLTTLAIVIQYILEYAFRRNEPSFSTGRFWLQLPFDILHVSDFFAEPKVVPLWYICAILWTIPIIWLVLWIPRKSLRMIISTLAPIGYYVWAGVFNHRNFPWDFLRAISGMLLGVLVCEIVGLIKFEREKKEKHVAQAKVSGILFTIVEVVLFLIPVVTEGFNVENHPPNLLCFFLMLTISESHLSLSYLLGGKMCDYLGKLSLPIFVWQWVVGTVIWCEDRVVGYLVVGGMPLPYHILLYIVGTLLTAIFMEFISSKVHARFLLNHHR